MSHTEHKMGAFYQTLHKRNATVTECFSLCITFSLFHIWTTNNFRVCLSQNAEDFTPVDVTSVMMKFLNKKAEI